MDSSSRRTSMESTAASTFSASQTDLQSQAPASAIRHAHLRPRRGSTASSVLSFGSAGTVVQEWKNLRDVGSSSISTLVDNPSSRVVIPRPTTRDIPPVNLSPIPKIKSSEFSDYLAIAGEYDKYRKAKDQGLEEHIRSTKNEPISPTPSLAEFAGLVNVSGLGPGSVSESVPKPRKSRRGNLAVTPLSAVPQVYFDGNFRLENPRIFDIVSERSDIIRPGANDQTGGARQEQTSSRKALASNAILQEKLSWYMDTVEVHLIQSISTASSTFFAALGDLRELHSEVADSVQKIHNIREELARIDEEQAQKGLEIIRLRRRRNNVAKLERAVKQMQTVVDGVARAKMLLADNEVANALDQVDSVDSLMSGDDSSSFDLRRVPALDSVESDLGQLRQKIGKAFEKHFVDTLLSDLQNHIASVSTTDTLQRFSQSFSRGLNRQSMGNTKIPAYTTVSDDLRNRLKEHLKNLQRAKWITSAISSYRNTATREVKRRLTDLLPIKDDDTEDAVGASIPTASSRAAWTSAITKLGPVEAEELLISMYVRVSELCRRLSTQQKLLLDLTMNLGETGISGMLSPRLQGSSSDADSMAEAMSTGLSDMIAPVLEVAQSKLVIILRARDERVAQYSAVDLYRYLILNKNFSSECEAVSGRVSNTFLSIINNQTLDFVRNYHNDRRTRLSEALAVDKWTPTDFDEQSARVLQRIINAATSDSEWWARHTRLYENTRGLKEPSEPNGFADANGADSKEKTKCAVVDEQKYMLPASSLVVLCEIERYEESISIIPSLVSEIATNMLDYLKVFNSVVCQLILGAGATKSAGLEHITAKHLALASQSLSFIVALIPYMREFVRRHTRSNAANVLSEFDKVKRLYQDHQGVIHDKLVTIITDRLRGHLTTVVNLDWEAKVEDGKPNKYMQALVRDTTILNKTLVKHLIPKPTHIFVMEQIFTAYKTRLVEDGFGAVELRSEDAKARMLQDVEYFNDKLSKVEGCGNTGEIILEAVRNKTIRQRGGASAAPTADGNA